MEIKNIAQALVLAQSKMSNAKKDSVNPFFKKKYADLNSVREACMPSLNENGIVVLQAVVQSDNKNYIKTILLHTSGEQIDSLTEIIYSKQNDAQSQGSGITYARRYGLQALVCIGAEDDDGQLASKEDKRKASENLPQNDAQIWEESEEGAKWLNDNFLIIKNKIEACQSEQELKTVWKNNYNDIARFKRYDSSRFGLLEGSKDAIKENILANSMEKELTPPE